jgi:hypothetical protein
MKKLLPLSLLVLLLVSLAVPAAAQTRGAAPDSELYRKIAALDAKLFEAFNNCKLDVFEELFAADAEFYHDQSGVTVGSKAITETVRKNICGGAVRRELVPGTLEVHPMHGYGALQTGVHRFTHPGKDDVQPVGEAQFAHLWQLKDGVWKITRVISYDHRALEKKK